MRFAYASLQVAWLPNQTSKLRREASRHINKFALELYGKLQRPAGQSVPVAIQHINRPGDCLRRRTRGKPRSKWQKPFNFPTTLSNEQFHKEFGEIIRQLNQAGEKGGYELVVANALWGQKDYKFLQEFLTLVRTNYDGDLQQVDFVNQTEAARKTINDWVESKTKDKDKGAYQAGDARFDDAARPDQCDLLQGQMGKPVQARTNAGCAVHPA